MNYDAWLMEPYEYPELYDFSYGTARRECAVDDWGHEDPDKYDDYEDEFLCYKKSASRQ